MAIAAFNHLIFFDGANKEHPLSVPSNAQTLEKILYSEFSQDGWEILDKQWKTLLRNRERDIRKLKESRQKLERGFDVIIEGVPPPPDKLGHLRLQEVATRKQVLDPVVH